MAKDKKSSDRPEFSKEDLKLLKQIQAERAEAAKGNKKDLTERKKLQEELNNAIREEADLSKRILALNSDSEKISAGRKKVAQEYNDYVRDMNDLLKDSTREQRIANKDLVKEMQIKKKSLLNELKRFDTAQELLEVEKARAKEAKEMADENKHNLELEDQRLEVLEKMTDEADKIVDKYDKQFEVVGDLDNMIKKLPGGDFLSKTLGTDKFQKNIQDQVIKEIANAKVAGEGLTGVFLKWGAALGVITILLKAVEWFNEMEGEAVKTANAMDITKDQAIELEHAAHDMAEEMDMMGVHTKEMEAAMVGLRQATGINYGELAETNKVAKDLVKTTSLLMTKQGMTAEEAAKLNDAAIAAGSSITDLAAQSELMGDKLVGGREIMQDIGKVSKSVLINFRKNPEALVKAVKKAKMLGTTLDEINKSGEAMLDIESSLEAEMKANVLTGKHMNLNKARELALMGDTAGLQDEIIKQMGSADEYLSMEPYKRKAIAEAMGMGVEELNTMMTKQKELTDLGISQEELNDALLGGEEKRAELLKEVKKAKGEAAAKALEEKYLEDDRMKTSEKFADGMKDLTDNLKAVLLPLLQGISKAIKPFADFFANHASWLVPVVGGIAAMALSMKAFGAAKTAISGIKDTVGSITGMLGKKAGGGGGLLDSITGGDKGQKQLDSLNKQADSATSIGKKIGDFGKGIGDFIKNIAEGIGGAIKGILQGLGEGLEFIAKGLKVLGKTHIYGLLGAAMLVALGAALNLAAPAFEAIAPIFIKIAEVIGTVLVEALRQAGPIITAIFEGIGTVIEKVGDAIATIISTVADSILKLSEIDGAKLSGVALGVGALALSMGAFGAGGALAGIGSALGEFFGGDPVEKFNRFASIDSGKLMAVATAISALGSAIRDFTSIVSSIGDTSGITDTIDKVIDLKDEMTDSPIESAVESVTSGIGDFFNAASSWVSSIVPGLESVNTQPKSSPAADPKAAASKDDVASLLRELIAKVDQPIVLKIGSKAISEIGTQTSIKRSISTTADKSYGTFGT